MSTYKLIDYFDVWRDEDGWQVNNLCTVADKIAITDDSTDKDIIDYLILIGFLNEEASTENVTITGDDIMIEIEQSCDGLPLGRLEKEI